MPFRALKIIIEIYKTDAAHHEPNRYSIISITNNRYNVRKAVRTAIIRMYQDYRRSQIGPSAASWHQYGRQVARELHHALHRHLQVRYLSILNHREHQQVQSGERVRELQTDNLLVQYDVEFDLLVWSDQWKFVANESGRRLDLFDIKIILNCRLAIKSRPFHLSSVPLDVYD